MDCRPLFFAAVTTLLAASPAMAGKRELRASRTTPLEMRKERQKVLEQMKSDGFTPIPKIIGGNPAATGEYPWMAALVEADEESNFDGQFCGATLIHPYWILTAGHCVVGSRPEEIDVVLGATNLTSGSGTQRIEVAEIILAPGYNDITLESDYALIRLKEPANASLTPLAVIDHPSLQAVETMATVTGWGDTTNGGGNFPSQLQEVQLPIVDLAVANNTAEYEGTLSENMLPAGFAEGGKDSCSGDSGGPLIVPAPFAPGWMQAGIVSFGIECAAPGIYGVYTRIGNFRDFVVGHIRPNYGRWERLTGQKGEGRDPDHNDLSNFEDYALPAGKILGQQSVAGMRRFSYFRQGKADEVEFIMENAPTEAGPWTRVFPTFVSSDIINQDMTFWTEALPEAGLSGVFRVRARYSNALLNNGRPRTFPGTTAGRLDETDLPGLNGNGRSRRYWLESFPVDITREVTLTLRSKDFDGSLRLINGETGAMVQTSSHGTAGGVHGQDESLTFTFHPGIPYMAEVISDGEGGDFELSMWDAAEFSAATALPLQVAASGKAKTAKAKGSLSTSDEADPLLQPGPIYYKDDFALDFSTVPAGRIVELKMASKGQGAAGIDDYLALIDAESGRLLAGNDNLSGRSNDAGIRFMPVAGRSYLLRASSALPEDTGAYGLSATLPKFSAKTPLAAISIGATVRGKLSSVSEMDESYFTAKRDYLLETASTGQEITVNLSAPGFDAYLTILDAADLSIAASGDGGGSGGGLHDARANFVARPGHRYIIRATTYNEGESGTYTLTTSVAP